MDKIDAFVRGLELPEAEAAAREHITNGDPCWCNPDVIHEEGGDVIVHNKDDNWQQYAKPGETAQQCIERHRAEQDLLMNLLAKARADKPEALGQPVALEPMTDDEIWNNDQIMAANSVAELHMLSLVSVVRAAERVTAERLGVKLWEQGK